MDVDLDDPSERLKNFASLQSVWLEHRAMFISRLTRGYQTMIEEREMMIEICSLIAEEQEVYFQRVFKFDVLV